MRPDWSSASEPRLVLRLRPLPNSRWQSVPDIEILDAFTWDYLTIRAKRKINSIDVIDVIDVGDRDYLL